ncbi:MAG: hypothetical protein WCD26_04345, partial [Pseudolabrys sp.]
MNLRTVPQVYPKYIILAFELVTPDLSGNGISHTVANCTAMAWSCIALCSVMSFAALGHPGAAYAPLEKEPNDERRAMGLGGAASRRNVADRRHGGGNDRQV